MNLAAEPGPLQVISQSRHRAQDDAPDSRERKPVLPFSQLIDPPLRLKEFPVQLRKFLSCPLHETKCNLPRIRRCGDIIYGQVWNLGEISILGCMGPICIPPGWKGEVIALRKRLRRKVAKQNRDLIADDLLRHADAIRLTYLTIRDGLNRPPRLANTDGDGLVFHTLKFRIESPERAFEGLVPLALGESKEQLLEGAEFGKHGKLHGVALD